MSDETTCPYCAETIKAAAIKCRFCGEMLGATTPAPPSPDEPAMPPPPTPVAATPAGHDKPIEFMIREDGKNGMVELYADRLVRVRKKRVGKNDFQTIPLSSINGVHHDRKTMGTDLVRLDVGAISYEWKVSKAEQMVSELHRRMF